MHSDFTAAIVEPIWQLMFELLAHPTYSLDLHWIVTCLDHQNKPCMDKDLPVVMNLWTQCVCGFDNNKKRSSQMG
jgi:hypothetical protein